MNISTCSVKYTRERLILLEALSQTGGKFQHVTPNELPRVPRLGASLFGTQWKEDFLELRSTVGVRSG